MRWEAGSRHWRGAAWARVVDRFVSHLHDLLLDGGEDLRRRDAVPVREGHQSFQCDAIVVGGGNSAAEAHLRALYQSRSPGQRLRMATAMFASAKRLVLAGLVYEDASRDATALRMALLQRLHGEELSPAVRATVASRR